MLHLRIHQFNQLHKPAESCRAKRRRRRSGPEGAYPGGAAVADEVGAGLLAVGGVEEPHGGDLGGLLVRVLLYARVEGIPCLQRRPVSSGKPEGAEERRDVAEGYTL